MSSPEPLLPGTSDSREPFSFVEFASGLGLNKFVNLVSDPLKMSILFLIGYGLTKGGLKKALPDSGAYDRLYAYVRELTARGEVAVDEVIKEKLGSAYSKDKMKLFPLFQLLC